MFDTRFQLKQNATQISFSSPHAWVLSKDLISIILFLILGIVFLLLILSIFLEKKATLFLQYLCQVVKKPFG